MTTTKRSSTASSKKHKKTPDTHVRTSSSSQPPAATAAPMTSSLPDSSTNATSSNANTNANSRLSDTTLCLPIVYGSIAFFLGKKADEYHTHRWTLYVRGPNDEDLSVGIARVVFQLHPSFPQPVRELTSPPFEVTEKGWGEFEATIRILWRDPEEKATVLTHGIKLYPPGLTTITPSTTSKEPVVHEFYDEVVFTNPSQNFHRQLMRLSVLPRVKSHEEDVQANFPTYSDESVFKTLVEADGFLKEEILAIKDRIAKVEEERIEVEEQLNEAAANKAKASAAKAATAGSGSGKGGTGGGSSSGKSKSSGGGSSGSKKAKLSH